MGSGYIKAKLSTLWGLPHIDWGHGIGRLAHQGSATSGSLPYLGRWNSVTLKFRPLSKGLNDASIRKPNILDIDPSIL